MDKFTVLREDLLSMASAGLTREQIGLTLLAMADYCMDGSEPDFGGDAAARIAFAMLKPRLDKYVRKCEANAQNGQSGGRPAKDPKPETAEPAKTQEEEPTETQQNPTKPNETQPKANETYDYEYEKDEEQEAVSVTPEAVETHTDIRQQGKGGRARTREGWFDPEHPDAGDDEAWRYSEDARRAIAQRIITHAADHLWKQNRYTDAGTLGSELFPALCSAMREGIPPGDLVKLSKGCLATWVWEAAVKEAVISQGGTANYPDWVAQLDEIRDELEEIRGDARAYG